MALKEPIAKSKPCLKHSLLCVSFFLKKINKNTLQNLVLFAFFGY